VVPESRSQPLDDRAVTHESPLRLFAEWYEQAREGEENASFMMLATANTDARPSVRTLQLEGFDDRGFLFYTGTESRKGRELAANPQAALCFYWHASGHQVRVEGSVVRASFDEDEAERAARAAESTDAHQSEPVADLADLESRVAELRARYGAEASPLPEDWGGYRLIPDAYEFWQYRHDKLHDRFRFELVRRRWNVERLFP
jgi:pyridoxamine 5'-phosphate oxidase